MDLLIVEIDGSGGVRIGDGCVEGQFDSINNAVDPVGLVRECAGRSGVVGRHASFDGDGEAIHVRIGNVEGGSGS